MRKDYGMLGELGLEVGDVVEREGIEHVTRYGSQFDYYMDRLCVVTDDGFNFADNMSEGWNYRVISRANPKRDPEIKTGILPQGIGRVQIDSSGAVSMHRTKCKDKIKESISTLNAIYDKMVELNQ